MKSAVASNTVLDGLREQIAHLESAGRRSRGVLPFGVAQIDERLPGGGLAYGALHECAGGGTGTVD
ncbi:damage-inducible mutagenesis protein, partial [Rhizobium ruizarguesonis]